MKIPQKTTQVTNEELVKKTAQRINYFHTMEISEFSSDLDRKEAPVAKRALEYLADQLGIYDEVVQEVKLMRSNY